MTNQKNYDQLLNMGIGLLIGSTLVGSSLLEKLGISGEVIAFILAGIMIVTGFIMKKKASNP